MSDISVEFSVVDRFSQAMDRFSEMVERCANGVDSMTESAEASSREIESISESSTVASSGFKGFGATMMIANQAMQAFSRFAAPVEQALDDIAMKQRAVIMFGEDAGKAFNRFAEGAAMSLGRVEGEIRKAGMKWRDIGVGGQNIVELTKLADRFANLNPDRSFEDIADSFRDAIKGRDIGGLADMLGGGEAIEGKLRRSGVERMLKSGNLSGAIEKFKEVSDSIGKTQEKADQMGMTIDRKLQKVANIGRNYITDMFSDIVKRAEPYVDRLLSWLQSDEVKEGLAKVRGLVSNVADMFFRAAEFVTKAAIAVYDFIDENKDMLMIVGGIAVAAIGFVKVKAGVMGVIGAIKGMNLALLASPIFWIPAAIIGTTFLIQKVFNMVTGESVSFIEMLVGIFVGGIVQIFTGIYEFEQRWWNLYVDIAEWGINGIIGGIESFLNWVVEGFDDMRREVLEIVQGIVSDVIGAVESIASTGLGERLGLDDALDTLKEFNKSIEASKHAGHEKFSFGRADFSAARADVVDSVALSGQAIGFVMDKINGLKDSISTGMFGDVESYMKDIMEELGALYGMADDLGAIRGDMQKENDLRWMKEMAEQRFVNEVNLRQLTPTINLQVKGANSSPQEYAKALARELQQMADAGTYNAYGEAG